LVDLSKDELNKLTKMAGLKVSEREAEQLVKDLGVFLTYAEQIFQATVGHEQEAAKNINVFREDKVYNQPGIDVKEVFAHRKDEFLVVPKVFE
jgi:aspartyl/glutamyl-tRNA(Asn/Gln) amidotransferase C subunit